MVMEAALAWRLHPLVSPPWQLFKHKAHSVACRSLALGPKRIPRPLVARACPPHTGPCFALCFVSCQRVSPPCWMNPPSSEHRRHQLATKPHMQL